jgi:hypothetical protein
LGEDGNGTIPAPLAVGPLGMRIGLLRQGALIESAIEVMYA